MRVVVARCSATYVGRGDTLLPERVRMIVVKDDGSLAIHNDTGFKPLNYMRTGAGLVETVHDDGSQGWVAETSKERLEIRLTHVFSDQTHPLDQDDPGLVRDGTEDHLQAWLAQDTTRLHPAWELVQREHPTAVGPVDLVCRDTTDGTLIAVEVKRVAMSAAVDQIRRYVEALREDHHPTPVRGAIAALDIRPRALARAARHEFDTIVIPPGWRGVDSEPAEPAVDAA